MNIDYLTHPNFADYNPFFKPSSQGGGGGIHVKTFFVREALRESHYVSARVICNASEIEGDIVLVEPLRFRLHVDEPHEDVGALLKGLGKSTAYKILLCTEKTMLTFSPAKRKAIVDSCNVVTASCEFQQSLFQYIGIYANNIVRDPISDIYCSPTPFRHRKSQVLAIGQISWYKNAMQLIEVFKRLNGHVRRVYVGSKNLWFQNSESNRLEDELYANTDEIIKEVPIHALARIIFESKFGYWCAMHDTTATSVMSMLRSGMLVASARHGYAAEIPVHAISGVENQVESILRMTREPEEVLAERSERAAKWCESNISYRAFNKQLEEVIAQR